MYMQYSRLYSYNNTTGWQATLNKIFVLYLVALDLLLACTVQYNILLTVNITYFIESINRYRSYRLNYVIVNAIARVIIY